MTDWRWISKTTGEDKTTGMTVALYACAIGATMLLPAVVLGIFGYEQPSLLLLTAAFFVALNGFAYYIWGTAFCNLVEDSDD